MKKKPKTKSYEARIGCWNCDITYTISIIQGKNTPEYLAKKEPKCKKCGCQSLKMISEWKCEKKIMKDLMLHHRITAMENENVPNKHHDYIK